MNAPTLIAAERLDWLREQVERLNRRADQLGVPSLVLTASEPGVVTADTLRERGIHGRAELIGRVYHEVEITGAPPVLAGWTLVAVLQHTPEGNILRAIPAAVEACPADMPNEFRVSDPYCDHCQTVRRRRDTYVVRHEDGRWRQVGSSCLRDFLGHDVATLIALAGLHLDAQELLGDCDPDGFLGFGGAPRAWALETFLRATWRMVRSFGWRSRKEYADQSTADEVMGLLGGARIPDLLPPAAEDDAVVERILAWGADLETRADLSDYLHNLLVVFRSGVVGHRTAGIAASAAAAYQREIDRQQQAEISHHVGAVRERREWTLTVAGVRYIDGMYGTVALYSFTDADGNAVKWFSSGGGRDLPVGATVTGKATVKAHEIYQGVAQTVVTRAAFEVAGSEAA